MSFNIYDTLYGGNPYVHGGSDAERLNILSSTEEARRHKEIIEIYKTGLLPQVNNLPNAPDRPAALDQTLIHPGVNRITEGKWAVASRVMHIVISILLPILFITAAALSIAFGFHPLGALVPVTSNFSLSIGAIVCSSVAGGVFVVSLVVLIVRRKAIKAAYERSIGLLLGSSNYIHNQIRAALHPRGRAEDETVATYRNKNRANIQQTLDNMSAVEVKFQAADGTTLRGYWHKAVNPDAPTMILFHGNAMSAEDMGQCWGKHYAEEKYNVLSVEFRGYGLSEGKAADGNQELYGQMDSLAGLEFVLKQEGINKDLIFAHGFSLGGAYAVKLLPYGVKVIIDHSLTSLVDIVAEYTKGWFKNIVATAIEKAYRQYEIAVSPNLALTQIAPGSVNNNKWDSIALIKERKKAEVDNPDKCKGDKIFVIQGNRDHIMPPHFGPDFIQAYYGRTREDRLVTIPNGTHSTGEILGRTEDMKKLHAFIQFHEGVARSSEENVVE